MHLSFIIFIIGLLGFIINRKNMILLLIAIEILLLAVTLFILISGYFYDDIQAQNFAIFIIAIAAAESAIGLGIIVAYYRLRGNLKIQIS